VKRLNALTLPKVLVVMILITAGFVAVDMAMKTIDIGTVPEWGVPYVSYIQAFFISAPIAALAAFGRNLLGYLRNVYKEKAAGHPQLEYNENKLYETAALYVGLVTTISTLLPPPYNWWVVGFIVATDFILSEIEKMKR